MNGGGCLSIQEFATNNCFYTLDTSPEQCNHAHIHGQSPKKKTSQSTPYLRIFSFADNKTGVIGINIKFAAATPDDYQLIVYATFPKVAIIDKTQSCQVVDA